MSSTLKKICFITTVNSIVLLELGCLSMAAPPSPAQQLSYSWTCDHSNNCSQGEFCQEDFGFSSCVPCVECSLFNREAGVECGRLKEDCGKCLPYHHEIDSNCTRGDNATEWSSAKMCLEHYSPSSDDITVLVVTGAASISVVVIAMLITSKLVSERTALQLEHEILTFANRQLQAVRDRLILQGDDSFRPTFTGNEPLDYNDISTVQLLANHEQLLAAALEYESRQEHQRRDILVQGGETSDDLTEASVLLQHTDEHRSTNEEPEQLVPHSESHNAITVLQVQVDVHRQEEMDNDIDDEEFYHSYSQERLLIE